MKSKERVQRAFHFDKPDRVPLSCMSLYTDFFPLMQFEPRSWQPIQYPPHVSGGDLTLANPFVRSIVYNWKKKYRSQAGYPKKWWNDPGKRIDEWGVIWQASGIKSNDRTLGHPIKGPLEDNWDGLSAYQIPDAADEHRYRIIRKQIWKQVGKNRYTLGGLGESGIFHRVAYLRGFSNLLIDMARNPNKVEELIKKISEFYLIQLQKYKDYYPTLDSIVMADDLGEQRNSFFSPRMFNNFFAPSYKKLTHLAHDLGMDFVLHSCGQIYDLIQPLIDAGVNVLEFDSPHMTGVDRFKHYAKEQKIAFWLSSNIQSTYTQGTPEEVEQEVKDYIKEVGNNKGGLAIYEYTQHTSIRTPKANIKAQRKAARKWGKYNTDGVIDWLS